MRTFEEILRLLKEYKEQYGDCLVPRSYINEDGIRLGWIVSSIRNGYRKTSAQEKAMLDSLEFVWKVRESPISFEEVIKLLKEYKEQYGDCLVPYSYTTETGIHLGCIISNIRLGVRKTDENQKAILNDLGFVWKIHERPISFEEVIKFLKKYKEQYGNCLVPISYTTETGIHLGYIVRCIRSGVRKTSAEEKAILDSLGFVWKIQLSFEEVIKLLKEYKEQYGDCLVPQLYTTKDGVRLGSIVSCIRSGFRRTNAEEKAMLDSLGFVWKVRKSHCSFEEVIKLLKEYKEQYGDFLVPHSYITEDGISLGWIVSNIRRGQRKTNAEEKEILNNLGFVWKTGERRNRR